jgi:hypothetical protein
MIVIERCLNRRQIGGRCRQAQIGRICGEPLPQQP